MTNAPLIIGISGFHGPETLRIAGSNWRPWNDDNVAVDMTHEDAAAMWAATDCPVAGSGIDGGPDCTCGGIDIPVMPAHATEPNDLAGTYLFSIAWLDRVAPKFLEMVVPLPQLC